MPTNAHISSLFVQAPLIPPYLQFLMDRKACRPCENSSENRSRKIGAPRIACKPRSQFKEGLRYPRNTPNSEFLHGLVGFWCGAALLEITISEGKKRSFLPYPWCLERGAEFENCLRSWAGNTRAGNIPINN